MNIARFNRNQTAQSRSAISRCIADLQSAGLRKAPAVGRFKASADYKSAIQLNATLPYRIFAANSASSERSPFWSSIWAEIASVRNRLTT